MNEFGAASGANTSGELPGASPGLPRGPGTHHAAQQMRWHEAYPDVPVIRLLDI